MRLETRAIIDYCDAAPLRATLGSAMRSSGVWADAAVRPAIFGNGIYPGAVSESSREPARRLPPGPHGLPPELVERNQRERLIAAMAEVCGERGYGETSVAEVAKRAGVSTASFYRQFRDKRECMLASFEELFARLLEGIERSCPAGGAAAERACAGAAAAAALLASDPPATRLLSLEVLAAGPEGVRAQHEALDRLAARLGGEGAWAAVAAMTSLVARRASEGRAADPAELQAIAEAL
ncbi:MAG TPA: helix-turn-helix domain-containing protein [Solirubrobacterales bacterium]|nr:helix-turn-helix domain-containing protein [Solirubrobacterales bacterium]